MSEQGSNQATRKQQPLPMQIAHAVQLLALSLFVPASWPLPASAADRFLSFSAPQKQHLLVLQDNALGIYPAQPLWLDDDLLGANDDEPSFVRINESTVGTSATFVTTEQCRHRD